MRDKETELLESIRDELRETKKLLAGISGFLGNVTLWGFLSGLLFFFSSQFAPGFFFTAGSIVAVLGIALALSSLHSSFSEKRKAKKGQGYTAIESTLMVAAVLGLVLLVSFAAFAISSR